MMFLRILAKSSSSTNIQNQSSTLFSTIISRSFSKLRYSSERPSFGIAFDIDGVILRGNAPIGGSPQALRRLYDEAWQLSGTFKVPYVFLTNGGGIPESKRALELEKLLGGVNILTSQVIQGHTPFKQLVKRFEKELVIAVGKGEPAVVMSEYGFKNVLSIDEYASCFDNIDPLAQFKKWTTGNVSNQIDTVRSSVCSQRVQAAFVVSDPIDWSRDIQIEPSLLLRNVADWLDNCSFLDSVVNLEKSVPVELKKEVLCDILRTGGLPGSKIAHQPPLYFASDDLEYQAVFPSERLGMGAFRIALESIFNSIHPNALEYTSFGKPNPSVFKNAETVLGELVHPSTDTIQSANNQIGGNHIFRTLYMIGDNPSVDIKGAQQAGHPWFSILTRTGVFKGKENHDKYPADLVVDTVEEAVDYIFRKEGV